MECGPFFALLRSFAELRPIQLERAQENIHDHLQRNLLHQALADQQAVRPDYPHCLPPRSFIGVSPCQRRPKTDPLWLISPIEK